MDGAQTPMENSSPRCTIPYTRFYLFTKKISLLRYVYPYQSIFARMMEEHMGSRKPLLLNSPNGMQVEFIAAGGWGSRMESQSLAGTISGDVYGWGCNAKGQLGKYVISPRETSHERHCCLECICTTSSKASMPVSFSPLVSLFS